MESILDDIRAPAIAFHQKLARFECIECHKDPGEDGGADKILDYLDVAKEPFQRPKAACHFLTRCAAAQMIWPIGVNPRILFRSRRSSGAVELLPAHSPCLVRLVRRANL